jgi:hypothetical protein
MLRIPQESHDTPIQQLAFNHLSTSDTNLLASVGKNQARAFRSTACSARADCT